MTPNSNLFKTKCYILDDVYKTCGAVHSSRIKLCAVGKKGVVRLNKALTETGDENLKAFVSVSGKTFIDLKSACR